jgi:hypothetical protein
MRWHLRLSFRSRLYAAYASYRHPLLQNSRTEYRSTLLWSPLVLRHAYHASESCHRYVPATCAMDERYSGPQRLSSDDSCGRCAFTRCQDGPCAQIRSYARVSVHSFPLAEVTDRDGILPHLYLAYTHATSPFSSKVHHQSAKDT